MNKNIAVVGGSGFVGSYLSSSLLKNNLKHSLYDIKANDNNINFLDVEKSETLDVLKNSSVIINLAAVHRDDVKPKSKYFDVNVRGASNICNCARKHNINKIIFTSSVAIYGFASKNTDENGQPNFFNDYGKTKYEAELIYQEWQKEDPKNRSLVIIRPTVIFGEGNRGNVFNLLNQINKKRFFMIGSGDNIKSMAYVKNVADFIKFSLKKPSGIFIHNYIDKPDMKVNELVRTIRKTLHNKDNVGIKIPISVGIFIGYFFDFLSFIFKKQLSISSIRIKKFLNNSMFSSNIKDDSEFEPLFTLEEGLIRTLKYEFLDNNTNKKVFNTE